MEVRNGKLEDLLAGWPNYGSGLITNLKFTEKILLGKEALKELYGSNPKAVDLIAEKIGILHPRRKKSR